MWIKRIYTKKKYNMSPFMTSCSFWLSVLLYRIYIAGLSDTLFSNFKLFADDTFHFFLFLMSIYTVLSLIRRKFLIPKWTISHFEQKNVSIWIKVLTKNLFEQTKIIAFNSKPLYIVIILSLTFEWFFVEK